MRLFGTYRSTKHFVFFVKCAAVLLGFLWRSHVQALPLQIDLRASAAIAQPMTMTNCQPCAMCCIGPPFAVQKASGDNLDPGATPVTMRYVSQTDSGRFFSDISEVPVVALRFLYCRWLN
ncbi:hypothetical protein [Janthinobacterium sp. TND4EL3]|jgi:hypothetical protein|uniref:hypothetical protein n=1 Tax=Janthinobacterium sp. TND4EL3 TaxID=1907311 RepID=UPI001115AD22|nr:hypothetical protein [Janthinobacterium sp. TND4EL3]